MADSTEEMSEAEATLYLMGPDPWLRFDTWTSKSWDVVKEAIQIAKENEIATDEVDHRLQALFHAASIAKDFAEMVNPLIAVSQCDVKKMKTDDETVETLIGLVIDSEDLDGD